MPDVHLGVQPKRAILHLTRDSGFGCRMFTKSGDTWPVGTQVSIAVGSATWDAAVTGSELTFSEVKTVVNGVIDEQPDSYKIVYSDGSVNELIWIAGPVELHDA